MILEVGKNYATRAGWFATIERKTRSKKYPFAGWCYDFNTGVGRGPHDTHPTDPVWRTWTAKGFLLVGDKEECAYDLVREVSETMTCPICLGKGFVDDPLRPILKTAGRTDQT